MARIAFGGKDTQTVRAFLEAESFPGPSLLIAYSPCIAHGYDLKFGLDQQKLAVESGYWPLYRFDPRRIEQGMPALQLDSVSSRSDLTQFMRNETRFRIVEHQDPVRFRELASAAQRQNAYRMAVYQQLAALVPADRRETGRAAIVLLKREYEHGPVHHLPWLIVAAPADARRIAPGR